MKTISETAALRAEVDKQRRSGKRIGLVPTMGNLHAGHLALVSAALAASDVVVTSIFVNPLQFGPGEDLAAYPRTLQEDQKILTRAGCQLLFAPPVSEIYSGDASDQTLVHVPGVSENYCGASRPGHFDGVATVVCKLFNIVAPDKAFFGLKDYQQFLVIRKMVADLALPVAVEGVEIVREESGLAMSSRNGYLEPEQKAHAAMIYRCLQDTAQAIKNGSRDYENLQQQAIRILEESGLRADYFAICRATDLQPASVTDSDLAILAAAYAGKSRLIDNIRFSLTA